MLSELRQRLDHPALDFSVRANLSEWMDQPCSYEEFRACLRDLARVNRVTLAYRPTRIWMRRVLSRIGRTDRPLHIVDVGSGQGDTLRYLARWARRAGVPVRLTGIDLNPYAARAAAEQTDQTKQERTALARSENKRTHPIEWVTSDALSYTPPEGIDLVISSLFTHHLPEDEIVRFLTWMERHARLGWFIQDLHRGAVPYHLFRLLARAARWHAFVQHDGPVSIRRSFRPEDWNRYLAQAGIARTNVRVETFRPARLCVGRIR